MSGPLKGVAYLPTQFPPDSALPDALVDAAQLLLDADKLLFVAAGNMGPGPGTMSCLTRLPGVISIGAASLDGTTIGSFSSRGVPGASSGPDFVCPGIDIVGARLRTLPPKTEAEARRDVEMITHERLLLQVGRAVEVSADLIERNCVMSGTSQACAQAAQLATRAISMLRDLGLDYSRESLLGLFQSCAEPVPNTTRADAGQGFVSYWTILNYLSNLDARLPSGNPYRGKMATAWREATGHGVLLFALDTGAP